MGLERCSFLHCPHAHATTYKSCASCGIARYCSRECQVCLHFTYSYYINDTCEALTIPSLTLELTPKISEFSRRRTGLDTSHFVRAVGHSSRALPRICPFRKNMHWMNIRRSVYLRLTKSTQGGTLLVSQSKCG